MKPKHYEVLGAWLRNIAKQERVIAMGDEQLGRFIAQAVKMVEDEAERDMRDEANGKGE